MTFFKKYWKIIIIFILTILLGVAIYLAIKLDKKLDESMLAMKLLDQRYDTNVRIMEHNQIVLDSIAILLSNQKNITITKTDAYEKVKSKQVPVNIHISDADLDRQLKLYRAKHKIK